MKQLVLSARDIQLSRYRHTRFSWNSELQGSALRTFAKLEREASDLLDTTLEALGLSMRAYDRILKISRTIADLEHSDIIRFTHVAEAVQYRQLDLSPVNQEEV
ncbi:hypothetical protein [Paenibacillus sp. F411]